MHIYSSLVTSSDRSKPYSFVSYEKNLRDFLNNLGKVPDLKWLPEKDEVMIVVANIIILISIIGMAFIISICCYNWFFPINGEIQPSTSTSILERSRSRSLEGNQDTREENVSIRFSRKMRDEILI